MERREAGVEALDNLGDESGMGDLQDNVEEQRWVEEQALGGIDHAAQH
jgi:hypothetical protein